MGLEYTTVLHCKSRDLLTEPVFYNNTLTPFTNILNYPFPYPTLSYTPFTYVHLCNVNASFSESKNKMGIGICIRDAVGAIKMELKHIDFLLFMMF